MNANTSKDMNKDSVASHYIGDMGKDYSSGVRQDVLNHFGFQLQKKPFLQYLNNKMNVLDFGCGNGSLAKAIEPYVATIEGVEVNECSRDLAINIQKLRVYQGLNTLSTEKKYDAIISNHVLEHIPNVIDTLKIIQTHLSPGGKFITMLPLDDFRSKINQKWRADDPDHHLHTWTPLLFGNTLFEAGFEPLELKVVTTAWTPRFFFLGDSIAQKVAGYLLSIYFKRRQLFAVAIKRKS